MNLAEIATEGQPFEQGQAFSSGFVGENGYLPSRVQCFQRFSHTGVGTGRVEKMAPVNRQVTLEGGVYFLFVGAT